MKKRSIAVFLMLILVLTILPLSVSANSPAPALGFYFYLSDLPAGTEYVDLLILLSESDSKYTKLNTENVPDGFPEGAEIFALCEEGFRSYTFHYADAVSAISVGSRGDVIFFEDRGYEQERYAHKEHVTQTGAVRLAMLDEIGNVLKVSPVLSLKPRDFFGYMTGCFFYNGATDEFRAETAGAGIGKILYGILCFAGMVLTCLIERLVAIPFGLKKQYGRLILVTNIVSQILMYVGYVMLYSVIFWKYSYATIILEILIYVGEYLVYHQKMTDIPKVKRFAYAMAANTASLVIGLTLL